MVIAQAVISIGGKGTRFKKVSQHIPKALYLVGKQSTLENTIAVLSRDGINKFLLLLGHEYEKFTDIIATLAERYNVLIDTYNEEVPLGECGALFRVRDKLDDVFLFLSGDIFFDMDIRRLVRFHKERGSRATLVVHTTTHAYDSDTVQLDHRKNIYDYKLKSEQKIVSHHLGNAGICILAKEVIKGEEESVRLAGFNLFRAVFELFRVAPSKVFGYVTSEYIRDMGTPERFEEVRAAVMKGKVEERSYRNAQSCLFLDRDGTLIRCRASEYICNEEQVSLDELSVKAITSLAYKYTVICIVTNQPQIAMGLASYESVDAVNSQVINQIYSLTGMVIDVVYVCPHHTDYGFSGEVEQLKTDCFCRKPNPGMLLRAEYELNIDMKRSLFIGDSPRDQIAAERARVEFKNIKDILPTLP